MMVVDLKKRVFLQMFTGILSDELHPNYPEHYFICPIELAYKGNPVGAL